MPMQHTTIFGNFSELYDIALLEQKLKIKNNILGNKKPSKSSKRKPKLYEKYLKKRIKTNEEKYQI